MVDEEQTQEQADEQTADNVEQQNEEQPTAEEESPKPPNTVTIEEAGPCKKKVLIEIPEEAIKMTIDEQYKTLRKEALLPGFRKGRAPRRLLEKRFEVRIHIVGIGRRRQDHRSVIEFSRRGHSATPKTHWEKFFGQLFFQELSPFHDLNLGSFMYNKQVD